MVDAAKLRDSLRRAADQVDELENEKHHLERCVAYLLNRIPSYKVTISEKEILDVEYQSAVIGVKEHPSGDIKEITMRLVG